MSKPGWVIDGVDVVHHSYCQMIYESATPYLTKPVTNDEMIEHLARPEVKDKKSAPSRLVSCDQCILGLALEEE